jgi:hypothetical protein
MPPWCFANIMQTSRVRGNGRLVLLHTGPGTQVSIGGPGALW